MFYTIFTPEKSSDFTLKVKGHPTATTVLFSKQWKSTKKNTKIAHIPSIHAKMKHLLP